MFSEATLACFCDEIDNNYLDIEKDKIYLNAFLVTV